DRGGPRLGPAGAPPGALPARSARVLARDRLEPASRARRGLLRRDANGRTRGRRGGRSPRGVRGGRRARHRDAVARAARPRGLAPAGTARHRGRIRRARQAGAGRRLPRARRSARRRSPHAVRRVWRAAPRARRGVLSRRPRARRAGRDRRRREAGTYAPGTDYDCGSDRRRLSGYGYCEPRSRAARVTMPRFKLLIEYNGARYSGWQIQKNARTVAGEIDRAIRGITRREEFELYGAGRTDAGVHALGQVAHLELYTDLAPAALRDRLNDALPSDIYIRTVDRA